MRTFGLWKMQIVRNCEWISKTNCVQINLFLFPFSHEFFKIFIYLFILQIYLFIGKSDIQRGGETRRNIICPMVHSSSDCNGWSWADLKPGARNFFQVSHVGAGFQGFGLSSTAFPGHKQGARWELRLPGLDLASIWDLGAFKGRTLAFRLLCWALNGTKFYACLCKRRKIYTIWSETRV